MQRWIVSFLIVAVAVGVFLYVTDDKQSRNTETTRTVGPPNKPLEESEVRKYIAIMLEMGGQGRAIAGRFEALRRGYLKKGMSSAEAQKAAQRDVAPLWEPFLARHQTTLDQITALRKRVEYVVDALREERDWPVYKEKQELKIAEQERLAAKQDDNPVMRKKLEETIVAAKERLAAWKPKPVHVSDRELATSFWADLDKVAPKIGPAPTTGLSSTGPQ